MAWPPESGGILSGGGLILGRFSSNLDWDRDGKRGLKEGFLVLGFGHPLQLRSPQGSPEWEEVSWYQSPLSRDAAKHSQSWRSRGMRPDQKNHSAMICCSRKMLFFWGKELWDWVRENFNLSPKKFQQGPMAGWWSGQSNWEVYFFSQGWQLTSGKTLQGRSSFCLCEGKIWAWILSLEFKCEIPKPVEESLWQLVTNWGR